MVFHWVLGLHTSRGEETPGGPFGGLVSVELSTLELSFGIAKLWEGEKRIRPFIGVGAALIRAEKETDLFGLIERDDATYLGLYVNGGAFWRFGKRFNLGIDGRYYYTDDEPLSDWDDLQDDVPSLDYVQIGMIVGWGW